MNIIRLDLDGSRLRIDIIQARFTDKIGNKMLEVCCRTLKELGVVDENITAATVPDVLEVLLVLQNMAASNQYDVLVAIGVVIRSETYHFELVPNESGVGVARVGLDYNIPIADAILTTENDDQAVARIEEKASDAAKIAVKYTNLVNLLLGEQFNEEDEQPSACFSKRHRHRSKP